MCPVVDHMTLWTLLWITVTTDFVVKFATVFAKAVIALLPRQILPLKKKVCTFSVFVSSSVCVTGFPRLLESHGKSWIFFLENSRTRKVWKIILVLESPGKISLKVMHFSSGSDGKVYVYRYHV